MLIVLMLICIALCVVCACIGHSDDWDFSVKGFIGVFGIVITAMLFCVTLGFFIDGCVRVTNLSVIDERIAMYQEENEAIENRIADTVAQYRTYETDIFREVSPKNSVAMVSLYPELKSDTLVQKQIEVYISNNEKIKELKNDQIVGKVYRWWVYFGG